MKITASDAIKIEKRLAECGRKSEKGNMTIGDLLEAKGQVARDEKKRGRRDEYVIVKKNRI